MRFIPFLFLASLLPAAAPSALAQEEPRIINPTATPAEEKAAPDAAVPPEPAVALAGSYSVESSTQPGRSGRAYRGDVAIAGKPGRVFAIKWNLAGGAGNYAGLGVSNGTVLAAGYSASDPFGIVVYDRKGDRWEGAWAGSMTKGQAGFETLEAIKANGDGTGTFRIVKGTTPGSSEEYRGEVRIEKTGDTCTITWKIAGGGTHRGVGLMIGDSLVAGWTPRRDVGVVAYKIMDGGAKLDGVWAPLGAKQLGTEVLARK